MDRYEELASRYGVELAGFTEGYLMCYEKDPNQCHRGILMELINGFQL